MTLLARNITEGAGNPAPPPPPDALAVIVARRADRAAQTVLAAMDADLPTYGPLVMAAWDRAHLASQEHRQIEDAYRTDRVWQGVRAML